MRACDRCGKGTQVGMNVSHSHIRTKKRFLPNLHALRIQVGDTSKRQTYCTKCLRTVKKEQQLISENLSKKVDKKFSPKVEVKEPTKEEKKPYQKEKDEKETVDISQELIDAK